MESAADAFTSALGIGFTVAAAASLLAAVVVRLRLPDRHRAAAPVLSPQPQAACRPPLLGGPTMFTTVYPSLDAFYRGDTRRRYSRERDIGLVWRAAHGSTFRAAWVQETGEVYLFRHGHPLDGGGVVCVEERRFELRELLETIAGYREVCGRPGSLAWLVERLGAQPAIALAA
jgi:hypothetical protein